MWAYIFLTHEGRQPGMDVESGVMVSDSENHDLALSSPLLLSRSFMYEVTESLYTQDSDTWGLQCKDQDLSGLYRRNKSMK